MAGSITTTKTASWGINSGLSASSVVTGVVTDYEEASEPVLSPEQNEVGSVINQTMYDKHETCSFTVQVAAGTSKPDAGAAITVGGKSFYVTSARITENNVAYRKIAVQAERYALCDATEAATGIGGGTGA